MCLKGNHLHLNVSSVQFYIENFTLSVLFVTNISIGFMRIAFQIEDKSGSCKWQ